MFSVITNIQLRKKYRNEVQNQTRQTQHTDSKLLINGETKNTFRKDQWSFEKEQKLKEQKTLCKLQQQTDLLLITVTDCKLVHYVKMT